jgi:hypothetical protein
MALRMFVGVLFLAGCYQPSIRNGGFTCAPTDNPPCPEGFYCVGGVCVDTPGYTYQDGGTGGNGDDDMASVAPPDDMAAVDPPVDMASKPPPVDLAQMQIPPDLAKAPPDLAKAPPDLASIPDLAGMACLHAGGACTTPDVCCSNYCRSDGICIGG